MHPVLVYTLLFDPWLFSIILKIHIFVQTETQNLTTEEETTMTEWLKHNLEPSAKVEEYMRKTASQRAKFIRQEQKSVGTILERYPRLLSPGMVSTLHPCWDLEPK